MTSEEKARLRELPKLIANENDPAKMKILAAELQRLLTLEQATKLDITFEKKPPRSS